MAVIDTFLKLLTSRQADRLVLAPEEIPILLSEGESSELPMPAVPADLSRRLAAEVAGAEVPTDRADAPAVEGTYRTAEGEEFDYEIRAGEDGCRIEMRALAPAEEEGADPVDSPRKTPGELRPVQTAAPSVSALSTGAEGQGLLSAADSTLGNLDAVMRDAFDQAILAEASDIFLSSGKQVQIRVHGVIHALDTGAVSNAQILQLLPGEESRRELEHSGSTDFAVRGDFSGKSARFRINVFRHAGGLAAALRPIRAQVPSLPDLQLPTSLLDLASYPHGLVLVTGASGSGKSTTLAALVDHINRTMARHIITIEDPIEFEYQQGNSLVHQRQVGADVESFSSGLRAALRENPDVILLGEMRDLPTISAALTAAETGHLVLSTLHTGSATAAVNRIVDVFTGRQQEHVRIQLAASLRAVVAQQLVPLADGTGRIPAVEKLIVNHAVASGIRDAQEHHMQSAIQTGAESGMITLERSLASLAQRGKITRETAFRYAHDELALQKFFD